MYRGFLAIPILCFFIAAPGVSATLITFEVEGEITTTFLPGVSVGDPFKVHYTFDAEVTDSQPDKSTAVYNFTSPKTSMSIVYGEISLFSENFTIVILDSPDSVDIYRAQMEIDDVLYSASFITSDPDVITDRNLWLAPPQPSDFTQALFGATDNPEISMWTRGEITSSISVNEPPSIFALLSAGLLLGLSSPRRRILIRRLGHSLRLLGPRIRREAATSAEV